MREVLGGPHTFSVTITRPTYAVRSNRGLGFSPPTTTKGIPKLYTYSVAGRLLYVGITRSRMAARLRYGLTAKGEGGYHGYKLADGEYRLDVWTAGRGATQEEMEGIEAEVAYLWRSTSGNWPSAQNEIHFHLTNEWQREQARRILEAVIRAG